MNHFQNHHYDEKYPSLCIPRVFTEINKEQIFQTIQNVNLGVISRIDMILKKNIKGETYQRVFIHFHKWNNTHVAIKARERLLSGKDIKIIYDEPWFWKISINRSKKY